ncbi:3'-5' exonuclease [Flavobacterium sp. W22_SRS_FP1]|uniref:3'-5' exonuclease n=1 Tax=Flavobacterium sp. W22_SRS_FP1 TaxID=3240276 RepID=UPI003F8FDB2C
MLDWLKHINKEFPEFWKTYLSEFNKKSTRYVILSTEASGLKYSSDVIFSIGAFAVVDDSILISDSFEVVLLQYKFLHQNKLSNAFIIESKMKKMGEIDGIIALVEFIGNAVIVGHHIDDHVEMINAALERQGCGRLRNEALDIDIMHQKLHDITDTKFSLDQLSEIYKIPKSNRNTASEDAYKAALLFLKLKSRLGIK